MKPGRLSGYRLPWNGEGWEPWLRALKRRSGVYVIREGEEIVYVGESHTGSLYDTITRHFQSWTGYTAGTRYDRDAVTVAVRTTKARDAIDVQDALIRRLRPRDNYEGNPDAKRRQDRVGFFWSLKKGLEDFGRELGF